MNFSNIWTAYGLVRNYLPTTKIEDSISGWRAYRDKVQSNNVQISYNEYMRQGNQRAYDDWERLYGSKGLSIRYPELSYGGAIAGYDAGISRAYLSNDIAGSEFVGALPYRTAGLYGVSGRATRSL